MRQGMPERAIEVADQVLPIAEHLRLDEVIADVFNNKGSAMGYLDRNQEAAALLDAAVRIAHAGGFVGTELRARNNQASTAFTMDPSGAGQKAREALELARRVGSRGNAEWVLQLVLITAWLQALDWDGALEEGREALAVARDVATRGQLHSSMAAIRVARGDPCDDALEVLEAASQIAGDPGVQANVDGLLADRALLVGDLEAALAACKRVATFTPMARIYLPEAWRVAGKLGDAETVRSLLNEYGAQPSSGWPTQVADRRTGEATLMALTGDRDGALAAFRAAIDAYRIVGYDFFVARISLDALQLLGAKDVGDALVAEARAIFESVGATPYLERLDAELARSSTAPTRARATVSAPISA
jgi:tetratricopeptide (TPR) repeat protein